jgi:hypothetical protein
VTTRVLAIIAAVLVVVAVVVVCALRYNARPETRQEKLTDVLIAAEIIPEFGTPAEAVDLALSICRLYEVGYDRPTAVNVLLDNGFDDARAGIMIDMSVELFCPTR